MPPRTTYHCDICKSTPDQLSHYNSHIKSSRHKDKQKLFELELGQLSSEQLLELYNTSDIKEISASKAKVVTMNQEEESQELKYTKENLNEKSILELKEIITEIKSKSKATTKINLIKAILKDQKKINPIVVENTNKINIHTKKISGTIIWNLENIIDENINYQAQKNKLNVLINECHNILRRQSIVGIKAQNDIMRILCLKLIQNQFNDENSDLFVKCNQLKETLSEPQYLRFIKYCRDLKEIHNTDVIREWGIFIKRFLYKLMPSVYCEMDNRFNCTNINIIIELINKIYDFEVSGDIKEYFASSYGDIYEAFLDYGGGKSSKELGQFFTPRKLIHLIFYGLKLNTYINSDMTIYDPCMGTGGFLSRILKLSNNTINNIYGCETEADTIKFGNISMLLTSGNMPYNLNLCDSLCGNEFIVNGNKFGAIVTNPPFGTKMKYQDLKNTFESKFPESNIKFEDIYPLETNNGACLFVQHCVYMLKDKGICAIVLPDGELFEGNSAWSKKFRKWLSEQVNILTILKVASGTFEHTSIKTNVVIFTKDGSTKNINFLETTKVCDVVKQMFSISAEELKNSEYSLDIGEYLVEETDNYDVPMVALSEVITKQNNFYDINADIDYKIVKMSKLVAPEIREIKKGCNIKSTKLQLVEESTFIMSKILNYCYGIYNNNINNGYLSSEYWIFKIRDNTLFNYFMQIYKNIIVHKLKLIAHGVGVPRINFKDFMSKIKIPLPSLEVQQQIVDELSQIETSIETIESRITQLKREKDQYKKYGRKAEIRNLLKETHNYDVPMVALRDLFTIEYGSKNPSVTDNDNVYPSISGGSKISKYTNEWNIPAETILIARSGSCGSVNKFNTNCLMGSYGFFLSKKNGDYNNEYIYQYLKFYQSNIESLARGTAVKNLNREKLYDFKIPIPSLEVQQQCIALFEEKEKFIQSIEDKISQEKSYIDNLKQLAKDIISSYCNGESKEESKEEKDLEFTIENQPYIMQKVEGDGHCFFSSVSLYVNMEIDDLRTITADNMLENIENIREFYEKQNLTLEEYIEQVRNTNMWADNDSIIALQQALNRPIIIYNMEGNVINESHIESEEEPIRIVYNGTTHYNCLVKK